MSTPDGTPQQDSVNFSFGLTEQLGGKPITARRAGDMADLQLCISPVRQQIPIALRNLAKALNLALKSDFIETPLDAVYKAARVHNGAVQILHRDYIGLGDGVFASLGKAAKSFCLTMRGPDAASPEGQAWIEQHGGGALRRHLQSAGPEDEPSAGVRGQSARLRGTDVGPVGGCPRGDRLAS